MKKGILGKKVGMTQVFTNDGNLIPVTVVEVEPNVVMQVKTMETDGYEAIQLGFDTKREKLSNKPEQGHAKKADTAPKRYLKEIRDVNIADYTLGQVLTVEVFSEGDVVDVTGTSKGKGFQGVIKRHNQSRGPMTHGSHFHRRPGSMGPMRLMRVAKGKKLPGHMGKQTITVQNLEIVAVDLENNVLLISGNIPGPKKSLVMVRSAIKNLDVNNGTKDLITYAAEEVVEEAVVETTEEVTVEETVTETK